ncbi:T9SS type A sorting domain-containing protein [Croceimicrobium sp.]|uniref:T9SS type A sorting domain-containing protein n=1 Tax=Croceimicrobium sp. TaxID=2828340 RepID=UPI003BAD5E87
MKTNRLQKQLLSLFLIISQFAFAQGSALGQQQGAENSYHIQKNTDEPGLYQSSQHGTSRILAADPFLTVESVLLSGGRIYVLRLDMAMTKTRVIYSDDQGVSWQLLKVSDLILDQLEINSAHELIAFNQSNQEEQELILSASQLALKETESRLRIYPNPVDDFLKIEDQYAKLKTEDIQLFSSIGQSVKLKITQEDNTLILDVSQLSPGMYYFNIQLEDRLLSRSILIK